MNIYIYIHHTIDIQDKYRYMYIYVCIRMIYMSLKNQVSDIHIRNLHIKPILLQISIIFMTNMMSYDIYKYLHVNHITNIILSCILCSVVFLWRNMF